MTVYRKRRQSQRQQQRQRRWTQRGGECGKFRGRSVPSVCALSPAEITAYSGVTGCSAAELITRIKSEGTCDPAKKIALLSALGEEPEKVPVVRHEVPAAVNTPEQIAAREASELEVRAKHAAKAEKAAAIAMAKEQATKNLEALRGVNAERKRFTTFLAAAKRIKTKAVQEVVREKLMGLSPGQIEEIRQQLNAAGVEADKVEIFNSIVSELQPVGLNASNGGRGNAGPGNARLGNAGLGNAGLGNGGRVNGGQGSVVSPGPTVKNTAQVNLGYPEPPPGSRGEQLAAALAENYPSLEELEAGQAFKNAYKRPSPPPPQPSSFYNMTRKQREEYYASRQLEAPGPSNNVNLLNGAGGVSYHLDPQFRPQGNNTTRTVRSSGPFRGGVRRKTQKLRS